MVLQYLIIVGLLDSADKSTKLKLWCFCSAEFGFGPGCDTFVPEHDTLLYNCFSPPRSKWVPVRAQLVIVIDKLSALHIWQHRLYTPQGAEMV